MGEVDVAGSLVEVDARDEPAVSVEGNVLLCRGLRSPMANDGKHFAVLTAHNQVVHLCSGEGHAHAVDGLAGLREQFLAIDGLCQIVHVPAAHLAVRADGHQIVRIVSADY